MALERFMSGLAIAALVAAAPVSAQTTVVAPKPTAERIAADSNLRGSNRMFGIVAGGLVLAALFIVAFRRDKEDLSLPKPVSP